MRLLVLGHLRRLSSFSVTNPSLCFSFKQRFPLNDLLRVQNAPEKIPWPGDWRSVLIIQVLYSIDADPSRPGDLSEAGSDSAQSELGLLDGVLL